MRLSTSEFESVYRRSYRAVYARARSLSGHEADAQDITQEAFAALVKAELDRAPSAVMFLFGVVTKQVIDRLRHRTRRNDAWQEAVGMLWPQARHTGDPSEAAAAKELLANALADADPLTAQLVVHLVVDGLSQGEIAEVLGVSRLTVNQRLQTLRATLRKEGAP